MKAAAAALEESERRFRSLADTVPVLVWLRNENGEYFFFNKTYLDFTGRTLEQEIAADYAANIHPDDLEMWKGKIQAEIGQLSRAAGSMEYRLRSAAGSTIGSSISGVRATPTGAASAISACWSM